MAERRKKSHEVDTTSDYLPTATLDTLQQRAQLLEVVRTHFAAAGYFEIETPILSRDTVVDAWLDPFTTRDLSVEHADELFLQTSPEFAMKRLVAAGATAIYQITRAFRQGERGQIHNPEFTMIEWYRVGDTYHEQMLFVEELVTKVMIAGREFQSQSMDSEYEFPFEKIAYDAAFERYIGSSVLQSEASNIAQIAADLHVAVPTTLRADDRDGWLNLLLAERIEPQLGQHSATFLYDYPASQAALATIRADVPPVAERFELYLGGIELCNGYQELTDADELRRRITQQAEIRRREGLRPLPADNRLLTAMQAGLPACSGVALGFDRLAMVSLGKASLAEVMAFPISRA